MQARKNDGKSSNYEDTCFGVHKLIELQELNND